MGVGGTGWEWLGAWFNIIDIIMTKLENMIVKNHCYQSLVKLYMRYVKGTLILTKEKDSHLVQKLLIFLYKNIKFLR